MQGMRGGQSEQVPADGFAGTCLHEPITEMHACGKHVT